MFWEKSGRAFRESLAISRGISFPSERVIRILDQIIEVKGKPQFIRTDNGPEFISRAYKH